MGRKLRPLYRLMIPGLSWRFPGSGVARRISQEFEQDNQNGLVLWYRVNNAVSALVTHTH